MGAVFEAPGLVAGLDDLAVVGQAIEQRGRHLRITEHGRPFTEGQVGGDDDRGAFVKAADQMEEQLTAGLGEGQLAQLIEDDEVQPGHVVGETTLLAAAGLCLEAVHEVDDVVEAAAGAVANEGAGNGDGEMGLSGARAADQDHIALIYHEAARCQLSDEAFVHRDGGEVELADVLGEGQLGDGQLVTD